MPEQYAIEMRGITKAFGSVIANNNVNLDLRRGEILALLGENLGLDDDIRAQHLGQHLGGLIGGVLFVRELLDIQPIATHHGALLACLLGGLFLCLGLRYLLKYF